VLLGTFDHSGAVDNKGAKGSRPKGRTPIAGEGTFSLGTRKIKMKREWRWEIDRRHKKSAAREFHFK